jgi:hypothetical protein
VRLGLTQDRVQGWPVVLPVLNIQVQLPSVTIKLQGT